MTDLAKTSVRLDVPGEDIVPLSEAVKVWARVAALSFGGPAGQIAVMHRIVVDEKRWVGEHRFLHALNYCMLLPGPEAHQLAIYIGWLLNKTKGGMIAGLLFVLPGFLAILALSYIYVIFGDVTAIEGLFFGLKCAVLAVVVQAVFRIGGRALKNKVMVAMAAAAFFAIFFLQVPFPLIIVAAGLVGYIGGLTGLPAFKAGGGHKSGSGKILEDRDSVLGEDIPHHARPNLAWSLKTSGALAALWLIPVAALVGVGTRAAQNLALRPNGSRTSGGSQDTAGKSEGSEAFWHLLLGIPGIDAGEIDVLPAERRDVLQQPVGNIPPLLPQMSGGAAEIDGVPVHDGADDQIEAGGAECLAIE